jgi:hypothetical protein
MTVCQLFEWHLQSPSTDARGEAAMLEAIASRSAMLSLGPYRFLYKDQRLPLGGHRLTLTPVVCDDGRDVLDGCVGEQHVPHGLSDWDEESDARLVATLGAALFRDVALLVASQEGTCLARRSFR